MAVALATPKVSPRPEHPFEETADSKVTYEAPANLALVKHWGLRDAEQTLPYAASISMTLSACVSVVTVEYCELAWRDEVLFVDEEGRLEPAPGSVAASVRRHLDRLHAWVGLGRSYQGNSGRPSGESIGGSIEGPSAGRSGGPARSSVGHWRVAMRGGVASRAGSVPSASGFAALTLAAVAVLGREASAEELSLLARASGRGSAARSVLGGWVVWPSPPNAPQGPAQQRFAPEHWDLRDVIAVVEEDTEGISSLTGHQRARSSVLFPQRLGALPSRLPAVERAIAARDLVRLGRLVEADSAELQAVALSSEPPVVYPTAGTLAVLRCVAGLRESGVPVYWSLDAGAGVHLLCEPEHERSVADAVAALPDVLRVLHDRVGSGPRRLEDHLF